MAGVRSPTLLCGPWTLRRSALLTILQLRMCPPLPYSFLTTHSTPAYRFERKYLVEPNLVTIKQADGESHSVFVPPATPDLRAILADRARLPSAPAAVPVEGAPEDGAVGDVDASASLDRLPVVDAKGRSLATGRRKASSARVWLCRGVGDFSVNGKPLGRYFEQQAQRAAALSPLTALAALADYTVTAKVEGGGAAPTLSEFSPPPHPSRAGVLRES